MTNLKHLRRSLSVGLRLSVAATTLVMFVLSLGTAAQAQRFSVLYSFTGGTDGNTPSGGLADDAAGNLYGTTRLGGDITCGYPAGCGTVFKLDAAGNETVLYRFTAQADGAFPVGGVIRDTAGNLYGAAALGGDLNCNSGAGCGVVFKLDAAGKQTVLHSFTGSPDGWNPYGGLIRDAQGNLYGTTAQGGDGICVPSGCGAVFKLDAKGKEAVLYSFTGGTDGMSPEAGVIRDHAGNLFGTTSFGGTSFSGTVFKLDSSGHETVLHSFASGADGENPDAGLLPVGADLYGTTLNGGTRISGTVFRLDKAGNETVVYAFSGGADGAFPAAGLVHDAAGNLYGTTLKGGAFTWGTVFVVDKTGKETVLHSFSNGLDGGTPQGRLIRNAAGNLYGATSSGGAFGLGTIFKIAR